MNGRVASGFAEQLQAYQISRKSVKYLDLRASIQRATQKPNFDVFR